MLREIAIINAHRRCFAPGAARVSATHIFQHLWQVAKETMFRATPVVEVAADTQQLIDRLRDKPVLALTGHVGNWEYLARYGTRGGYRLSVIARPARNRVVQKILERLRGDLTVVWRSGSSLKAAAEILKAGNWVGALIDQDLEARGIRVPGFGLRAHTPSSLVELAIKSNSHIIAAFMVRQPKGHYRLIVHELKSDSGVADVLSGFQTRMQQVINEYPEQWVWFHKRWRTTRNERISGKKYVSYLSNLCPLGEPFIVVHAPRVSASSKS